MRYMYVAFINWTLLSCRKIQSQCNDFKHILVNAIANYSKRNSKKIIVEQQRNGYNIMSRNVSQK